MNRIYGELLMLMFPAFESLWENVSEVCWNSLMLEITTLFFNLIPCTGGSLNHYLWQNGESKGEVNDKRLKSTQCILGSSLMAVLISGKVVNLQDELLVRILVTLRQYEWLQCLYKEWSEKNVRWSLTETKDDESNRVGRYPKNTE